MIYAIFEHRRYGEEIIRDSDGDYLYTSEEHTEKEFIANCHTYEIAVEQANKRLNTHNYLTIAKPIKLEFKQVQNDNEIYLSNEIADDYNCNYSYQIIKTEVL